MIKSWLEKTVIGLDLCPFARRPYLEGKILIQELLGESPQDSRDQFLTALSLFQGDANFETALLVYPNWKISFEDFFEFSQDCEDSLESLTLQEEFQLVAFHPQFRFEGLEISDKANLVNSSPFPLIHILKISDLELLNLSTADAEAMSKGNGRKLEALSEDQLMAHFPWR